MVELRESGGVVNEDVFVYLNRFSDALFVLARVAAGEPEPISRTRVGTATLFGRTSVVVGANSKTISPMSPISIPSRGRRRTRSPAAIGAAAGDLPLDLVIGRPVA